MSTAQKVHRDPVQNKDKTKMNNTQEDQQGVEESLRNDTINATPDATDNSTAYTEQSIKPESAFHRLNFFCVSRRNSGNHVSRRDTRLQKVDCAIVLKARPVEQTPVNAQIGEFVLSVYALIAHVVNGHHAGRPREFRLASAHIF